MIVWKDIFKPRYAIIVTLERMPKGILGSGWIQVPCVPLVPLKRPLNMSFNEFYNTTRRTFGIQSMTIAGSYWTLRRLYGVGSTLKHNIDNATKLRKD